MIDFGEIEKEIIGMEANRDTSYATMERLAPLYCAMIYKKLISKPEIAEPQALPPVGDSEFLAAIAGKDSAKVWAVIDDLMDDLKTCNIRIYDSVLRKIKAI